MSNIDKLAPEKKAKIEGIIAKAEAAALKAAVEAPAPEPVTVIPNTTVEVITGPTPYTRAKAEALDKKIVATVTGIGNSLEKLETLVAEAKEGQIHIALEFASWTAYFADRVNTPFAAIGDRQVAALMLHEEGLSNRAIGAVLGVSPGTVITDVRTAKGNKPVDETEKVEPKKTVGKDGKGYTRKPVAKKPAAQPKPKPTPVVEKPKSQIEQIADIALADAQNVVEDLETLTDNIGKLYSRAAYKPGMDKEIRALITKARKLIAELPKAPSASKGA